MVAGLELPDQRQRYGSHPRRGRARGLGAFKRRHAPLEHVDSRIGKAGILIARVLALKPRFGLGGSVIDVALGEKQRLRSLAEWRTQGAGLNQTRLGAIELLCGRGHVALLSQQAIWPRQSGQNKTRQGNPRAGLTRPRPFSDLFYVAASRPAQMTTG